MAEHDDWLGEEQARIARRRAALGVEPPGVEKEGADGAWGLALSGGGIRSATFALGLLQGLALAGAEDAKAPGRSWLRCFDYLSPVSGGGYVGSFFASLFLPQRLVPPPGETQPFLTRFKRTLTSVFGRARTRARPAAEQTDHYREAAERAYEVLEDDPPGRVRSSEPYNWRRRPLAWLRENGRYLTPTGAGDFLYVAALAIRNWVSLHYVIGTALLLVFALVACLKTTLAVFQPSLLAALPFGWHGDFFALAAWSVPDPSRWQLWWSALWALPLAVLVLWIVPSGIAFWLITDQRGRAEPPGMLRRTFTGPALADAALALLLALLPKIMAWLSAPLSAEAAKHLSIGASLLALLAALGLVFHVAGSFASDSPEAQRVVQTRVLASGLTALLALAALAFLDTLSETFYFWLSHADSVLWRVAAPGALLGALVWLVRKLVAGSAARKEPLLPAWLPLDALAAGAALVLLLAVATAWAMLAQWFIWSGRPSGIVTGDVLAAQYPSALALLALALVPTLINGFFPNFINLSTLQAFYSARITRAYLGASNGARFAGKDRRKWNSAAEPHPADGISRAAYYDPKVLAPLHLINVTLDQTIDPAEQLVQRDRKGKPLAVGPAGYLLDGRFYPHESGSADYPVGEWVGISGAAVTTAVGRATTLGLSLLLGLANVRLGVWWRSSIGRNDLPPGLGRLLLALLPTQTFLAYELSARFHGEHRAWLYLSDGGHFENSAAYELLRPEREVSVIVASDNGCDPEYRFADLATLFRLARIDFRAQFTLVSDFDSMSGLDRIFGRDDEFAQDVEAASSKCALLYRVTYSEGKGRPRWLIVVKPRVVASAPLDVWEYKQGHPEFPQESTTDQFFDEAQWESYRKLGLEIGRLVFAEHGAQLLERLRQGA